MKLTKDQLIKVNELNRFIFEYHDHFSEYNEDLIFSEERLTEIIESEEEIMTIEIYFPGEDEEIKIDINEYLLLSDEVKSLEIIEKSYLKTNLRSYYIVGATETEDDYIIRDYDDLEIDSIEGVSIKLVNSSVIVGLAATKLGEFDSDMWGTARQYLAIEIIYERKELVLNQEKESELVTSYIFELADSIGVALNYSEIRNPTEDYYELDDVTESLRDLVPYNEGMKLFVSAIQIKDPELKFLNFYKVLEHFSPIAVNIEANELMRKKLDARKSSFEDGDFIRSIFELATSTRDRFNDEDLIKASFNACFDFVGLFSRLPESIKKKIKKQIGAAELTYSTDKHNITTASNIAGRIIYKTRNKVVHAKSNYTPTGDEITGNEFQELNDFMKEASSQAIRWYTRQPNHLKLDIMN